MDSLFLELSQQESLLKMMEERGYKLCQQNGQRTYGGPPPGWGSRPPPDRDCEVFIGRLPRMCFEDELIPLFSSMGELYEFRLMLDFSGTNRGYAYAHYATLDGATRAIKYLNKFEIRPGHLIGVLKSKNNCRLLFGNIKATFKAENFSEFIRTATHHVLNVLLFDNFNELKSTSYRISSDIEEVFLKRVSRSDSKFAIVEYENHKAAAVARRVLIPKYGHILAIDWAVPPSDKNRYVSGSDTGSLSAIECPTLAINQLNLDSEKFSPFKTSSKIRPVPELIIEPSVFDHVSFMQNSFMIVVKFFKYQLSLCLFVSVDRLKIPVYVCNEIERKIVDRITNFKNCSQAVQLIFNYFSRYNDDKRFVLNAEVQILLQEIKIYSDAFVHYVNKKIQLENSQIPSEDFYYTRHLPFLLNILFRIILGSTNVRQVKLSGITKGLNWIKGIMQNDDTEARKFVNEIVAQSCNEHPASLDRAISISKCALLNSIVFNFKGQNSISNWPLQLNNSNISSLNSGGLDDGGLSICDQTSSNQRIFSIADNHNVVDFDVTSIHAQTSDSAEYLSNTYPAVPLLEIRPSITDNISKMSRLFYNTLVFFKHLLRVSTNAYLRRLNVPQQIYWEIENKIINRISNLENCAEGVQLILKYFSLWTDREPERTNKEVQFLLQEIKMYSSSFVHFIWSKTLEKNGGKSQIIDNFYCNVLPLKLTLLYQIILICSNDMENSFRYIIRISQGLAWLDNLIENGNQKTKDFIGELTRFVLELDPIYYERAKSQGKKILKNLMNLDFLYDIQRDERNFSICQTD